MKLTKAILVISITASVLMAVVSVAGIFSSSVYAKESASWTAQGAAQDVVNLAMVFPLLSVSAFLAYRRVSRLWFSVWLGLILYTIYAYVLYSFFMHFGMWMLPYVAILGLSFYALVLTLLDVKQGVAPTALSGPVRKALSVYLILNGALFGYLWLSEIIGASLKGAELESAASAGFWINPVHVLDLAFILPAMIATGVSVWRRSEPGSLFALPILVFAVTMGVAVIAMAVNIRLSGIDESLTPALIMGVNVALALLLCFWVLKSDMRA
jgi:hypothetical protein